MTRLLWATKRTPMLFGIALFLALPSSVVAHQLDEYLQATIVEIDPDVVRLKVNLTPGVEVAAQVLDRIDRDHDDAISADEAKAYGESFAKDVTVQLDQRALELKLVTFEMPSVADVRTGWGIIKLEFSADMLRGLSTGVHTLAFDNRHLPGISVYLINAAQPTSPAIRIQKQSRNNNQSNGRIEFTLHSQQMKASPKIAIIASAGAILFALIASLWRRKTSPRAA